VTDLAETLGVIGVVTHQGGHVERHAQTAAAGGQDHLVALIGLLRITESGKLTDGPGPAPVATRIEPAGERELSGPADPLHPRVGGLVRRTVDRINAHPRQRREVSVSDPPGGFGGRESGQPARSSAVG
jgi:hypothetical protein